MVMEKGSFEGSTDRSAASRIEDKWQGAASIEAFPMKDSANTQSVQLEKSNAAPSTLPPMELGDKYSYHQDNHCDKSMEKGSRLDNTGSATDKTNPMDKITSRDKTNSTEKAGPTEKLDPSDKTAPTDKTVSLEEQKAARGKYEAELKKQVEAASMSPTVNKGEGYYQVLQRNFADVKGDELKMLAEEVKTLNGGKQLHTGESFKLMNNEQKLRLIDQLMNKYDSKNQTDALDKYGDFAPEKGRLAAAHNKMRNDLAQKVEAKMPLAEKPVEVQKPEEKKVEIAQPEKLSVRNFAAIAKEIMPKIDIDHDGTMSHEELLEASKSKEFNSLESQMVAGLLGAEKEFSKLSNDRLGTEKGISANDLSKFEQMYDSVHNKMLGAKIAERRLANDRFFSLVDQNNDGKLTKKELKSALQDNDYLRWSDRTALHYLLDNYKESMKAVNDETGFENSGVSRDDIAALRNKLRESDDAMMIDSVERSVSEKFSADRKQESKAKEQEVKEAKPRPVKPLIAMEALELPAVG